MIRKIRYFLRWFSRFSAPRRPGEYYGGAKFAVAALQLNVASFVAFQIAYLIADKGLGAVFCGVLALITALQIVFFIANTERDVDRRRELADAQRWVKGYFRNVYGEDVDPARVLGGVRRRPKPKEN